jgi:hypothetical protein
VFLYRIRLRKGGTWVTPIPMMITIKLSSRWALPLGQSWLLEWSIFLGGRAAVHLARRSHWRSSEVLTCSVVSRRLAWSLSRSVGRWSYWLFFLFFYLTLFCHFPRKFGSIKLWKPLLTKARRFSRDRNSERRIFSENHLSNLCVYQCKRLSPCSLFRWIRRVTKEG